MKFSDLHKSMKLICDVGGGVNAYFNANTINRTGKLNGNSLSPDFDSEVFIIELEIPTDDLVRCCPFVKICNPFCL